MGTIGDASGVARQVRVLFGAGAAAGLSDGQLVERFAGRTGEAADAAFETVVRRHGPLVLGTCRRLLRDPHEADDAFQATFLVLVRKAGEVRVDDSLGPWLHGVAHRIASRARSDAARRPRPEPAEEHLFASDGFLHEVTLREMQAAVHEELGRLPEKFRAPVVLFYLQGHTHDEAAERLRWPVGTVRSRLARARDLLRSRLTRRGLALPAGLVGLAIAPKAWAVPPALLESTIRAASRGGAASWATTGSVSATVALMTKGAMRAMFYAKLKIAAVGAGVAVAATLATAGAGARAFQADGRDAAKTTTTAAAPEIHLETTTATAVEAPTAETRSTIRTTTVTQEPKPETTTAETIYRLGVVTVAATPDPRSIDDLEKSVEEAVEKGRVEAQELVKRLSASVSEDRGKLAQSERSLARARALLQDLSTRRTKTTAAPRASAVRALPAGGGLPPSSAEGASYGYTHPLIYDRGPAPAPASVAAPAPPPQPVEPIAFSVEAVMNDGKAELRPIATVGGVSRVIGEPIPQVESTLAPAERLKALDQQIRRLNEEREALMKDQPALAPRPRPLGP